MTDPFADLVARIERLEAIAEITQLSAHYCRGADRRDLELFLSVWSEDAVWRVRDDLAFVGIAEIRRGIERQWEVTTRAFHWTSNPSIEVDQDGSTARATFDVVAEVQLLDGSWQWMAGDYRDTYARSEVGWRLRERTAEIHADRSG